MIEFVSLLFNHVSNSWQPTLKQHPSSALWPKPAGRSPSRCADKGFSFLSEPAVTPAPHQQNKKPCRIYKGAIRGAIAANLLGLTSSSGLSTGLQ